MTTVCLRVMLLVLAACTVDHPEHFARLDLSAMMNGVLLYRNKMGKWPSSLQEIAPPQCRGTAWCLKELHNDPWNHPYTLMVSAKYVTIVSAGPDGRLGNDDDLEYSVDKK